METFKQLNTRKQGLRRNKEKQKGKEIRIVKNLSLNGLNKYKVSGYTKGDIGSLKIDKGGVTFLQSFR